MGRIRDDWESAPLAPAQKAALACTDALLANSEEAAAELREALLANFSPAEIVDLGVGIALFIGFSKIAIALGGIPEQMPTLQAPMPGS